MAMQYPSHMHRDAQALCAANAKCAATGSMTRQRCIPDPVFVDLVRDLHAHRALAHLSRPALTTGAGEITKCYHIHIAGT